MAGSVRLCRGDLFGAPADMVVLPISTAGTITSAVRRKLEAFSLPVPPARLPLGGVDVQAFDGLEHISSYVAYAASVESHSSSPSAITTVGRHLGRACVENESIRQVSCPLLGAGAGGLEYMESFSALTEGFLESAPEGALLSIYALRNDIFDLLISGEDPYRKSERTSPSPERIFLSYAHSDDSHKQWVKTLATALRSAGFEARLDAWHLKAGMNMPQWMSNELDLADRCILICDDKYVQKADGQHGGVGWEYRLIQGDIFRNQATAHNRFIPVVTSEEINLPAALKDCLAIHCPRDSGEGQINEDHWERILEAVMGGEAAPPISHA